MEDLVLIADNPHKRLVIVPWIIRNGKRIYPKRARFFRFWVPVKA